MTNTEHNTPHQPDYSSFENSKRKMLGELAGDFNKYLEMEHPEIYPYEALIDYIRNWKQKGGGK